MNEQENEAKEKVIGLFHRAYGTCPAYKDFVDAYNVDVSSVRTASDFAKIPIMDKENYLHKYSLEEKLIDNCTLADFYMITASSGSTGNPTFWPRDYAIDTLLEKKKEELYEQHFHISQKKTLILVTFALGMWTAGMLTAKLTWACAKDNNVSVISTGMNRENIFQSLINFEDKYDQVIILGYPPFIINVIHFCEQKGYNFSSDKIKIMYTAETLSATARKYLAGKVSKKVRFRDVVGFYASSEAGIIAAETPGLAELAQLTHNNKSYNQELYDSVNPATLYAYNPLNKYLEEFDGEILLTSDQPVPLIRYNIHDRGGIRTKSQLLDLCAAHSIDSSNLEIPEWSVFVHGRSNAVVMTANIYIEDVKYCLDHSQFAEKLSGHFKFGTIETEDLKKQLKVTVFLKPGGELTEEEQEVFIREFSDNLFRINSDLSALRGNEEYLSSIAPIDVSFSYLEDSDQTSIKLQYFL